MDAHSFPSPSAPPTPAGPAETPHEPDETLGWGPKTTVMLFLLIAGLFAAFSVADLIVGLLR